MTCSGACPGREVGECWAGLQRQAPVYSTVLHHTSSLEAPGGRVLSRMSCCSCVCASIDSGQQLRKKGQLVSSRGGGGGKEGRALLLRR